MVTIWDVAKAAGVSKSTVSLVVNNSPLVKKETRERVGAMVRIIDPDISIHDFRMIPGPTHTKLIFDVEVPYQCALSDQEVRRRVQTAVRTLDDSWSAVVEIEKSYI